MLTANLAAHGLAGDLPETPAAAIVGLWIGFGFWATTAAVFTDRIAAYLLRLDVARTPEVVTPGAEVPVDEHVAPAQLPARVPTADDERIQRLTARIDLGLRRQVQHQPPPCLGPLVRGRRQRGGRLVRCPPIRDP